MRVVRYTVADEIAVITLNRPDVRNAISAELAEQLEACIDALEEDGSVRVGVLAGAPPAFCSGADLRTVAQGGAARLRTDRGGFAGIVQRERRKPLVAAVDGPALAGGTEIALACDIVICSTAAKFGLPEVKRGLIAGAGGLFRLGRCIPFNVAMKLALTGDELSGEAAYRYGLAAELCDPGMALETALAVASRIRRNAPLAVQTSRAVMRATVTAPDDLAWQRSREAFDIIAASEDVSEGILAFRERREPTWQGK